MDDLTFRKTVLSEPFSTDPKLLETASLDPQKQAFWDEIKAMEIDLQAAMNIPIPVGLEETLLAKPFADRPKNTNIRKRPWYLALAASVVFASVLSFNMLNGGSGQITSDVLAHMSHVDVELMKNANLDASSINKKLANFNGQVSGDLGEIISANFCYLDEIKSLHLIIRGENGLTSLFVMPDSVTQSLNKQFNNATYEGASFLLNKAKIIVVGSNKSDIEKLEERAKQAMSFT